MKTKKDNKVKGPDSKPADGQDAKVKIKNDNSKQDEIKKGSDKKDDVKPGDAKAKKEDEKIQLISKAKKNNQKDAQKQSEALQGENEKEKKNLSRSVFWKGKLM